MLFERDDTHGGNLTNQNGGLSTKAPHVTIRRLIAQGAPSPAWVDNEKR